MSYSESDAFSYKPLVYVLAVAITLGAIKSYVTGFAVDGWVMASMGYFVCVLAFLKLINIPTFAKSFARYDFITARVKGYGWVYPWLELAIGLGFLLFAKQLVIGILAVVLGLLGGISIVLEKTQRPTEASMPHCACTGGTLKVPLGVLSIAENLAMVAMGGMLLS